MNIYFNMEKQMLLLVDNNDKFLNKYEEKELCHIGKGIRHRAFVVVIQNQKGEVLLQKRKHKRWDNFWDVSAISHVLHFPNHDETYEKAGNRALKDEMGIIGVDLKKISGFNYFAKYGSQCENEYCAILIGDYNGIVIPNKKLMYEYKWVKKEDFLSDIKNNPKEYTPWAILTTKEKELIDSLKDQTVRHVAFIMDGNRRWAREHNLHITAGHTKGYHRIETIVDYAHKKQIPFLTFWAFSTENWNREKKEVEFLMQIFRHLFKSRLMKKLQKNKVKAITLGDLSRFPEDIAKSVKDLVKDTKDNTNMTVAIGLNYGGRDEILRAVSKIAKEKPQEITQDLFSRYLFTKDIPDPDLIIRTGGEMRLSGFLPWQGVYSELYFTNTYWPDFDEKEFEKALLDFKNRQRRFGK